MNANATQPRVAVPTPAWLQRRMMQNLILAAHSRVSRKRAAKARAILVAACVRGSTATPQFALPDTTINARAAATSDPTTHESPRTASMRRSTFSKYAHKAKAATADLSHVAKMMARQVLCRKPGRRAELTSS